jgi:hypothetical protein
MNKIEKFHLVKQEFGEEVAACYMAFSGIMTARFSFDGDYEKAKDNFDTLFFDCDINFNLIEKISGAAYAYEVDVAFGQPKRTLKQIIEEHKHIIEEHK